MVSNELTRCWALTINNYSVTDIQTFEMLKPQMQYYIIGFEVSKDRRTPHLQCYFQLSTELHFLAIKKFFPRAHIEIARLDSRSNISYCKKEGCYIEYGLPY